MVFKCNIFPGHTTLKLFDEIQHMMEEIKYSNEQFFEPGSEEKWFSARTHNPDGDWKPCCTNYDVLFRRK